MGKTVKTILRLIVTAAIVVGVVFGISYLITPKADSEKIANAEIEYKLSTKIEQSYSGYVSNGKNIKSIEEVMPSNPIQYYTNTKTVTLPTSKHTNDLLSVYCQYYISISSHVKSAQNDLQSKVVDAMKDLNSQVSKTIEYLEFINAYANRNSNYAQQATFYERVDKWVESYQKQTELEIKLADILREYVCKANYQTSTSKFQYIGEVKLEIYKDYAMTIYQYALKGRLKTEPYVHPLLNDNSNTGFSKTYQKFIEKAENVVNPNFLNIFKDGTGKDELTIYLEYGEIGSLLIYNKDFDYKGFGLDIITFQAGYYQMTTQYGNADFSREAYFGYTGEGKIDEAKQTKFIEHYFGEDIEVNTPEFLNAQRQYIALNALNEFLAKANA